MSNHNDIGNGIGSAFIGIGLSIVNSLSPTGKFISAIIGEGVHFGVMACEAIGIGFIMFFFNRWLKKKFDK